jgi:hypothetical protein
MKERAFFARAEQMSTIKYKNFFVPIRLGGTLFPKQDIRLAHRPPFADAGGLPDDGCDCLL